MAGARGIAAFILLLACAFQLASSFSEDSPSDQNILVLLDDGLKTKSTHSLFFQSLRDRGYQLDIRSAEDPSLALQEYGRYLYDAAIILAPSVERLGGNLDVEAVLEFVDAGHDLILAVDETASDLLRDIATECGVGLDETPGARVVDHQRHAVSEMDSDHTLVLGAALANASVILGEADGQDTVLFRGIGMAVSPETDKVVAVLSASPAAYTAEPGTRLEKPPALFGASIALVAAMQARNNARVVISGSLELFGDEFFRAQVRRPGGGAEVASANAKFAEEVSKWALHERGHLKAVNLRHHRAGETSSPAMYRVSDHAEVSLEIYEWSGASWQPYLADDVQVQFFMMSPYVLKTLSHDSKGLYSTSFQVPDVYGVFQIKVEYSRLGYTTLALAEQTPVRPFRHDEYERFIGSAFPYYTSAFSMMAGFFILGFAILYHK